MAIIQDHRTLPVASTPEPSQTFAARAWRYVTGAPRDGYVRTDATFFKPATAVLVPTGHTSRWHKMPGWKRAAWRLGAPAVGVAAPVGYLEHPLLTTTAAALAGACMGAHGVRKTCRWAADRKHRRSVVQPLLRSLVGPLGLPLNATADKWLMVPRNPARPGQITRIWLPDTWVGEDVQKLAVTRLVSRWLDAPVEAVRWHLSSSPRFVEFSPTPQPPDAVKWKATGDPYVMHVGKDSAGEDVHLETLTDNPHAAFVGGSGSGKTTALTLPLVHSRQHGALVDIIDLKRMSFTERKPEHPNGIAGDPSRPSGVVSGVRIATTLESAVRMLAEFLASATAVALMQQAGEDTSHIPARVLLVDEFGSFAGGAKAWWKGPAGQKTPFVVPFWMHVSLMQGRALDHRIMLGAHQLALNLFGGSDARDLFSGRLVVGECSAERWITTFGRVKKPAWDSKVKGRGAYGALGSVPSLVQTAYLPQAEANGILRGLPEAPEWFDRWESAPWITEDYIREVEASYSAGRWVPGWEHLWEEDTEGERHGVTVTRAAEDDTAPVLRESPVSWRDVTEDDEEEDTEGERRLSLVKAPEPRYSLAAAAREGIVPMTADALRQAKRRPGFPPAGPDGKWSADELRAWHRERRSPGITA